MSVSIVCGYARKNASSFQYFHSYTMGNQLSIREISHYLVNCILYLDVCGVFEHVCFFVRLYSGSFEEIHVLKKVNRVRLGGLWWELSTVHCGNPDAFYQYFQK